MNLAFKSQAIFENFCKVPLHPKLTRLLLWLYDEHIELIVTSAYRDKKIYANDPGIHGTNPLRAIDLRSWIMPDPEAKAEGINEHWIYDSDRPSLKVCVYHNVGQGDHFHLQVHDNTIKREV